MAGAEPRRARKLAVARPCCPPSSAPIHSDRRDASQRHRQRRSGEVGKQKRRLPRTRLQAVADVKMTRFAGTAAANPLITYTSIRLAKRWQPPRRLRCRGQTQTQPQPVASPAALRQQMQACARPRNMTSAITASAANSALKPGQPITAGSTVADTTPTSANASRPATIRARCACIATPARAPRLMHDLRSAVAKVGQGQRAAAQAMVRSVSPRTNDGGLENKSAKPATTSDVAKAATSQARCAANTRDP